MQPFVCTILLLLSFVFDPSMVLAQKPVPKQEASSMLDRLDSSIKNIEPNWKLVKKLSEEKSSYYQWESGGDKVGVYIIATASPGAAAETLKQHMLQVSVGPTAKLQQLGDEAYVWKGSNRDTCVIRFRKANSYIKVSANSSAVADRFSNHAADLVSNR